MSYTKQNFESGATLYASQLNAMDEQIYQNTEGVANLTSNAILIDTTLTIEGAAADAKAVGDKISEITGTSLIEPAEDDIPKIFFGGALQQTKDEVVVPFRYISKTEDFSGYAEIKAQGNSSMDYPKKNQTVKMFADADCTEKLKVDFKGWGKQNKHCYKANWIDLSHARNVVSARIWADVVKSRADYLALPELLRTSPNQGAVDGFPIKVYAAGIYQGRYTLNIPKDKWTFNMDDDLEEHCVLCGENYDSGCFRAAAKINETDWTDEIHDTCPDSILTRWNEVITFVMTATDDEFRANLGNYFYVDSLIDYHLFGLASCGLDAYGKNQLYATYDGQKWIASMYDMDSAWGLYWNGSKFVETDYPRTSYEDYVSYYASGEGNLLYNRLEQMFWPELQARWAELKNGALSIENIINRFERFTDIAPAELVKEDYASTTGGGAFTGIPSQTTNNIQQIRAFALARQAWTDEYVAGLKYVPCTGITLSASTLSFASGEPQTLTATLSPEDCTENVIWESDDTEVATVENGVVTPIANGSCTITATCGSYSATCAISVTGMNLFTVTNNLTNVTTDNESTTAAENGSYSANLAVTGDEYALDAVTVTMGGVDITATAYADGVITIETVTGDIVITATAKTNPVLYTATNFAIGDNYWEGTTKYYVRDSRIKLLENDIDFTVAFDAVIPAEAPTSWWANCFGTNGNYNAALGVQNTKIGYKYIYDEYTQRPSITLDSALQIGDRVKAMATHTAGSGAIDFYVRVVGNTDGTDKIYTMQDTGEFVSTTQTMQTGTSFWTTIDEFTVYNYAMTADEANAWLAE